MPTTRPRARRPRRFRGSSPRRGNAERAPGAVATQEKPLRTSQLPQSPRHVDVLPAVLLDQIDTAFLPPLQALEPIPGLRLAQVHLRQMIERHAESDAPVDLAEEIERPNAPEVAVRVAREHLEIEAVDVESHDAVRQGEIEEKTVDVTLVI